LSHALSHDPRLIAGLGLGLLLVFPALAAAANDAGAPDAGGLEMPRPLQAAEVPLPAEELAGAPAIHARSGTISREVHPVTLRPCRRSSLS
jgi:hypothetical protein